jgi:hypothetical protein
MCSFPQKYNHTFKATSVDVKHYIKILGFPDVISLEKVGPVYSNTSCSS